MGDLSPEPPPIHNYDSVDLHARGFLPSVPKDYFSMCRMEELDNVPNFYAEDDLAGTHIDGMDIPHGGATGEVVVAQEDDELHRLLMELFDEPDNDLLEDPVVDTSQFSEYIPEPNQLVQYCDEFISEGFSNAVTDELLDLAIAEGDFIELDDLIDPLLSLNSSG